MSLEEYIWHAWMLRLADTFDNKDVKAESLKHSVATACISYWKRQITSTESKLLKKLERKNSDFTRAKIEDSRNKLLKILHKDRGLIEILTTSSIALPPPPVLELNNKKQPRAKVPLLGATRILNQFKTKKKKTIQEHGPEQPRSSSNN